MCFTQFPQIAEMLWSQESSWQFSTLLVTLISAATLRPLSPPKASRHSLSPCWEFQGHGLPLTADQAWMQWGAASTAGHKLHHALPLNAADCRKCSFWWPHGRVQALPPAGAAGAAEGGLKKVLGSSPRAKGGTLPRSAWGVRDPLCSHTPNWAPACGASGYPQSPVKQQSCRNVREACMELREVLAQLLRRGDVGERLGGE